MATRHRGLAWSLRSTCAASLLALTLPTISSAAPIGEQIDRADGIAGTSALADTFASNPRLSDDGRFAAFTYHGSSGSKSGQIAPSLKPVLGLYVRDIVANRTVQLVATGDSGVDRVQITADGSKVSFTTGLPLVASDTDLVEDVYVADVATKALTLVTATTERTSGFITRDGSAIVASEGTTLRRIPLNGGPATTLATNSQSVFASNSDGTTVAHRPVGALYTIVFARAGRSAIQVQGGDAKGVILSPDGKSAALLPFDQRDVRALNVETGVITPAAWRVSGYATDAASVNLSNDGWLQVIVSTSAEQKKNSIGEVNLFSRAIRVIAADLPWRASALTPNGRFATTGYGHLFVVPVGTTPLPGTVDPPSPFAYLRFDYGCRLPTILLPNPKPYIAVAHNVTGLPIPAPVSANIVVRDRATNQIANQFTITSATATYLISPVSGNFRVDASVKLADGRTVSGTYFQDSYARAECFPNGL